MEISKTDDLGDIANLGLTIAEAKQLHALVQCEISTAQAREHAIRRPVCSCRDGVCRVKDYRDHSIATLFGQVTIRLPRFLCALCGRIETGINWPSHCRSTPELDRLRAHLSALMSPPVAADLLEQMFPVDTGTDPATLRRHTLKVSARKSIDRIRAVIHLFRGEAGPRKSIPPLRKLWMVHWNCWRSPLHGCPSACRIQCCGVGPRWNSIPAV